MQPARRQACSPLPARCLVELTVLPGTPSLACDSGLSGSSSQRYGSAAEETRGETLSCATPCTALASARALHGYAPTSPAPAGAHPGWSPHAAPPPRSHRAAPPGTGWAAPPGRPGARLQCGCEARRRAEGSGACMAAQSSMAWHAAPCHAQQRHAKRHARRLRRLHTCIPCQPMRTFCSRHQARTAGGAVLARQALQRHHRGRTLFRQHTPGSQASCQRGTADDCSGCRPTAGRHGRRRLGPAWGKARGCTGWRAGAATNQLAAAAAASAAVAAAGVGPAACRTIAGSGRLCSPDLSHLDWAGLVARQGSAQPSSPAVFVAPDRQPDGGADRPGELGWTEARRKAHSRASRNATAPCRALAGRSPLQQRCRRA